MLFAGEGGWRAWPELCRVDLRRRVVSAIASGLSCRAAAERFGVSTSSAIRWRVLDRREGDIAPRRQGGDRTSRRIEAHAERILSALVEKSDITLAELRDRLKETASASASERCGGSSNVATSRAKKDGACRRATSQRGERGARSLVRRSTRPRRDPLRVVRRRQMGRARGAGHAADCACDRQRRVRRHGKAHPLAAAQERIARGVSERRPTSIRRSDCCTNFFCSKRDCSESVFPTGARGRSSSA